ncbi:unnamed protein product [Boreogadus saida]
MESPTRCGAARGLLHPIQEEPSRKRADVFTGPMELSSGGLSGTKTPQLSSGGLAGTRTLVVLSETPENRTLS